MLGYGVLGMNGLANKVSIKIMAEQNFSAATKDYAIASLFVLTLVTLKVATGSIGDLGSDDVYKWIMNLSITQQDTNL